MKLTSPAFSEGGKIPNRYSQYGENKIPPLHIEAAPAQAESLVLIVEDPDASNGTFTHWLLFNLGSKDLDLGEENIPFGSSQGRNDSGYVKYHGPKPPSGEHRYFFKAYALDSFLPLLEGAKRDSIESAMKGHVLASAILMGKCAR